MTLVDAPTQNQRLLRWVDEMVELSSPTHVHWFDGSDAEREALCKQLVDAGHLRRARPERSAPARTGRTPTRATSPGSRTAPSSAPSRRSTPGPPTTGSDPAEMRATLDKLFRGCDARPHHVRRAVQHGPARLAALVHRRRDHRLALRRGEHGRDDPRRPGRARRARRRRRVRARACTRSAHRSRPARTTCPGRATPTRSGSCTSPRRARSGRTARATAATPCSARSASRCASRR